MFLLHWVLAGLFLPSLGFGHAIASVKDVNQVIRHEYDELVVQQPTIRANSSEFAPLCELWGIAAVTDFSLVRSCLYAPIPERLIRTFFVESFLLEYFVNQILLSLDSTARFVLVSGGGAYDINAAVDWKIVDDSRIVHWFAENHKFEHSKISTLPTGTIVFFVLCVLKLNKV